LFLETVVPKSVIRPDDLKKRPLVKGAKDLSGQKFGHLTAIRPVVYASTGGGTEWLCQCVCGEHVVETGRELGQKRNSLSCGCRRFDKWLVKAKDYPEDPNHADDEIKGARFGTVTVRYVTQHKRCKSRTALCDCDCGRTFLERLHELRMGRRRRCFATCPLDKPAKKKQDETPGLRVVRDVDKYEALRLLEQLRDRGFALTEGVVNLSDLKRGQAGGKRRGEKYTVGWLP